MSMTFLVKDVFLLTVILNREGAEAQIRSRSCWWAWRFRTKAANVYGLRADVARQVFDWIEANDNVAFLLVSSSHDEAQEAFDFVPLPEE
ncbi:predicted protein [Plenodomus lingam JN3]|uniref:Predicted protein n=1 Tax=Leptosphaeria maculans (strain JN3 / isolate v23.1.3 / race Av1-4-5-6-7-8) TaxID=985895 RepID=E4ZT94_LEPMJ|nr:predicted protein [Plenodomus lingam JN3]CBX90036.1 predicted protein [Plenodomus lingam JN3]